MACTAIAPSAMLHIIALPPPPFSSSTHSAPPHYPVSPPAPLRHHFGILVQALHQQSHQLSLGSAHSIYSTSSFSAHQLSSIQESLWDFGASLLRFCPLSLPLPLSPNLQGAGFCRIFCVLLGHLQGSGVEEIVCTSLISRLEGAMAVSKTSACTQLSSFAAHADLTQPQSPKGHAPTSVAHLKNEAVALQGAPLRSSPQTRSKATTAIKVPKQSRAALQELVERETSAGPNLVRQVSEDVVNTSGEFLDAVDSGIEAGAVSMRVRKSSGKSATRTSRRRALVMCLALGMVPNNVTGGIQNGDLRRTTSTSLRRSASSSFTVSGNLSTQVSIASSLKAANLLDDKEDLLAQL